MIRLCRVCQLECWEIRIGTSAARRDVAGKRSESLADRFSLSQEDRLFPNVEKWTSRTDRADLDAAGFSVSVLLFHRPALTLQVRLGFCCMQFDCMALASRLSVCPLFFVIWNRCVSLSAAGCRPAVLNFSSTRGFVVATRLFAEIVFILRLDQSKTQ